MKTPQTHPPTPVDHEIAHPNVYYPSRQWAENQTLHVATAYSNPCRWRTRRDLNNNYRRHIESSANALLYMGELAYGDRPFDVTDPNHSRDFQWRTAHELWHKENILNSVISRFPTDWEYGAYIDGDFLFTRHDWALEAVHLLQHYDWVQLFSSYTDLTSDHKPWNTTPSFAYTHQHGGFPSSFTEVDTCYEYYGTPHMSRRGPIVATGGAWAFRRSAFNAVGGLLDTCILGAGDWHMALGLAGLPAPKYVLKDANNIRAWRERAALLKGNIGCMDCHAIHYFHGSKTKRAYSSRSKILRQHNYDPVTDIFRDSQGIYQLTGNKPQLRDDIRRYFRTRGEDDPNLYGKEESKV